MSCVPKNGPSYGYTTTFQRAGKKNPPNYLRRRGIPADRRRELRAFASAARGTHRGPGDDLAGRSETRTDAARGAWLGNAGTGRHSLDSGTNQRHGRTNRSAARRHRAPEFGHSGTQRSPAATRPVGRRVPAQGRGSRFRALELVLGDRKSTRLNSSHGY